MNSTSKSNEEENRPNKKKCANLRQQVIIMLGLPCSWRRCSCFFLLTFHLFWKFVLIFSLLHHFSRWGHTDRRTRTTHTVISCQTLAQNRTHTYYSQRRFFFFWCLCAPHSWFNWNSIVFTFILAFDTLARPSTHALSTTHGYHISYARTHAHHIHTPFLVWMKTVKLVHTPSPFTNISHRIENYVQLKSAEGTNLFSMDRMLAMQPNGS